MTIQWPDTGFVVGDTAVSLSLQQLVTITRQYASGATQGTQGTAVAPFTYGVERQSDNATFVLPQSDLVKTKFTRP